MKVVIGIPMPALNGSTWLALLLVDGLRFRLITLLYTCRGCGGYHVFTGF